MLSLDSDCLREPDLHGARIWLSGAVPEPETWGGAPMDRNVREFARAFAGLVFKYKGRLIHGCHPSITPVLVHQAQRYQAATPDSGREQLRLVVSSYFGTQEFCPEWQQNRHDWQRWSAAAEVEETPIVRCEEDDPQHKLTLAGSLAALRQHMADAAQAFVAVGGKWWDAQPGRAGIPIEFDLAQRKGIPCFILGGFGGISSRYADEHPQWFRTLRNGLADEVNRELAGATDLTMAAGMVVAQLERLLKPTG